MSIIAIIGSNETINKKIAAYYEKQGNECLLCSYESFDHKDFLNEEEVNLIGDDIKERIYKADIVIKVLIKRENKSAPESVKDVLALSETLLMSLRNFIIPKTVLDIFLYPIEDNDNIKYNVELMNVRVKDEIIRQIYTFDYDKDIKELEDWINEK